MRIKLILAFAVVVIISVGSVVLVARQNTEKAIHAFLGEGKSVQSDQLVAELESFYSNNYSWNNVEQLIRTGHGNEGKGRNKNFPNSYHIQVLDSSGKIVADSWDENIGQTVNASEVKAATPLKVEGNTVGYLIIQETPYSYRKQGQQLINKLNQAALTAALIAGGISLLIALLFTYQLIKPINNLTKAAKKLGGGDLSQRVEVHGNDEIAILGKTFNHMADSLQEAESLRKAMTADIAHELRTPLSIQRANLEAIKDGIYPPSQENLILILEQNLLLSRLVEDLRTLAIADAGELNLFFTETDVNSLISHIINRFQAQANTKKIKLVFNPSPIPKINLDITRIEQILNNLLSNAIRHSPENREIIIQTSQDDGFVLIKVKDSGPGIPPDALPNLFKRFYRVDKSRNREDGGTGLGLAIAYKLAKAHGGDLIAQNDPNSGAVFTLSLPINPQKNSNEKK